MGIYSSKFGLTVQDQDKESQSTGDAEAGDAGDVGTGDADMVTSLKLKHQKEQALNIKRIKSLQNMLRKCRCLEKSNIEIFLPKNKL